MADPNLVPPVAGAPASTPQPKYTAFRGPNGLRAGWRVLLFLLIVASLFFISGIIAAIILHGKRNVQITTLKPLGLSVSEGMILLFTSIAALIMARIERRHYGQYGLPAHSAFRKNFWIGTLVGFLAISACLLAIFALHGFHLDGLATQGHALFWATLEWTGTFILVGLSEEFAFRGYLQYTLTTGIKFWPAAFLLSALFGLAHVRNPGESGPGVLSVVVFGLLFCLFLRRTGNLWWAVGFHAGWDWGQTFFYGVHDSGIPPYHSLFASTFHGPNWLTGGTVGPEASLFTPIVLAVVALLFHFAYRENRYHPLTGQPETRAPIGAGTPPTASA